ncbi:methyl-accepting chemotaxis protein [Paenibacillus sanfengchensis]|uniref:methyl-accepting chemotaxis protein n=1 Tax=Paenibacillus sanfengchensis TaxID=3119819 RepID=UPI002FE1BAAA
MVFGKIRKDLRVKLYLIMVIPLLVMGALILWTTQTSSENASLLTIQHNNQRLTENTAKLLGQDADGIKRLNSLAAEDNDQYKSLRDELVKTSLQSGALYIYMYNHNSDGWFYTVDGAPWDDEDYNHYGDEMKFDPEIERQLLNGKTVTTGIVHDPTWGPMLSSFTPIKDAGGEVIGYLGIDISAKAVHEITAGTLAGSYRKVLPIFAAVLILSLIMIVLLMRGILKQVGDIKSCLEQMTGGNLKVVSRRITKDQLGDISEFINHLVSQWTKMLQAIQQGSQSLQQSSTYLARTTDANHRQIGELSRAIEEIATGSMKQAEETDYSVRDSEQLGGIMDEVGSYVNQFSDTSERLSGVQTQVTREHELLLVKGRENAEKVAALQAISQALTEKSRLASSISDQIHNILKQTQILSLNASIEAARAGEAGKGFAVVAGEMGLLARQSEQSIQEIDTILESFVRETYEMASHFNDNLAAVQEQEEQIVDCLRTFGQVSEISAEIQQLARRLESRTTDMHALRQNVEHRLSSIAAASEETSAMTEEVSASAVDQSQAAEELSKVSVQLQELAGELKAYADRFQIQNA